MLKLENKQVAKLNNKAASDSFSCESVLSAALFNLGRYTSVKTGILAS
jgi:hypothetical protein